MMGSVPLNGNDARAILGIVFGWIETEQNRSQPIGAEFVDLDALVEQLESAGYRNET